MVWIPFASEIGGKVKDWVVGWITQYYIDTMAYKSNVMNLSEQHGKLLNEAQDIERRVEDSWRLKLEKKTNTTEAWLNKASEKSRDEDMEVKELLDVEYRKSREHCCGILPNIKLRHDMSVLAKGKADGIKDLMKEPPREPLTHCVRSADLKAVPTEFLKGLRSRDKLLEDILEKLKHENVDIVGIFGMGSIGKTTLAKELKGDQRCQDLFDEVVMVEISENPHVERIQDEIADQINLSLNDVHNPGERAKKIYNRLNPSKKGKEGGSEGKERTKLLVIMDNIWKELDLKKVGIPHPDEKSEKFSCKLILTSRERNVCKTMGSQDDSILKVDELKDDEAMHLFEYRLKRRIINVKDYEDVGRRLLKRSGNLPLAIVALADMLRDQDLSAWKHFAHEMEKPVSSQIEGVHRETYAILETSYKLMKNKEKKLFFLLACLFPLGSSILIKELMRYGIGLGLFQNVRSLTEAMEQASRWTQELISSSLLLEDDKSEGLCIKIHDVVRASSISIAREAQETEKQAFMVEEIPGWMWAETCKTYTAISLMPSSDHACLNMMSFDKLHTLILRGSQPSKFFDDRFFQGMKSLNVLALSSMSFQQGFPESIAELTNLRTLHLEFCEMGDDFSSIGKLENLFVLSLRGSYLIKLPIEIGNLRNLRLLDLSKCFLRAIPANIFSRLTRLEGLYMYDFEEWADVVNESHDGERKDQGASAAELMVLHKLNVLEMRVRRIDQLPHADDDEFLKNLARFQISVSLFTEYDLVDYDRRKGLHLDNLGVEFLQENIFLKALLMKADYLKLSKINCLEDFIGDLGKDGLGDINNLEIKECKDLKCLLSTSNWMNDVMPFSNLKMLKLEGLDGLQSHVLPVEVAVSIKLRWLEVTNCSNLEFIFAEDLSGSISTSDSYQLPFLRNLKLIGLPRLQSLLSEANCCPEGQPLFSKKIRIPLLEELNINDVPVTNIWDVEPTEDSQSTTFRDYKESFRNLKTIKIEQCNFLKCLGVPALAAALQQLETLHIIQSANMMEVITMAGKGCSNEVHILFPKLKELHLADIDKLVFFCRGSRLELPALKELLLHGLPCMTALVSSGSILRFPALQDLSLYNLPCMIALDPAGSSHTFLDKIEAPCLEQLSLKGTNDEAVLWQATKSVPPKLSKLQLDQICGLRIPPEVVLQHLSSLKVTGLQGTGAIISFGSGTTSTAPTTPLVQCPKEGHHLFLSSQLPNLREIEVGACSLQRLIDSDEHHPTVAAELFSAQIKILHLNALASLEGFPSFYHAFQGLNTLHLENLSGWEYIWSADLVASLGGILFPHLEELTVKNCWNLEFIIESTEENADKLDSLVLEFPRLKHMVLEASDSLLMFSGPSSYKLNFPMLERIEISSCDGMLLFSPVPLVAPKLSKVFLHSNKRMWLFSSWQHTNLLDWAISLPDYESSSFVGRLRWMGTDEWVFSSSSSGHIDDALYLPSLRSIEIGYCPAFKTFSSRPVRAPKLKDMWLGGRFMVRGTEEFFEVLHSSCVNEKLIPLPPLPECERPPPESESHRPECESPKPESPSAGSDSWGDSE